MKLVIALDYQDFLNYIEENNLEKELKERSVRYINNPREFQGYRFPEENIIFTERSIFRYNYRMLVNAAKCYVTVVPTKE